MCRWVGTIFRLRLAHRSGCTSSIWNIRRDPRPDRSPSGLTSSTIAPRSSYRSPHTSTANHKNATPPTHLTSQTVALSTTRQLRLPLRTGIPHSSYRSFSSPTLLLNTFSAVASDPTPPAPPPPPPFAGPKFAARRLVLSAKASASALIWLGGKP